MKHQVRIALDFLGIETMRFIREFDVCEYSFAFTRTEALPTTRKHNMEMPVRLNLFPEIGADGQNRKHPIYAIKQVNETFYVQLSEGHLRAWLVANNMPCDGARSTRLGGWLIENYDPVRFTRFIDAYRREGMSWRDPYAYVFGLLHTLAYHMIQVMAASSGLEQGSFGEHLFVPNLGFVVYRRGITMDLGNLSAMWREGASTKHGNAVLHALLEPSIMRCGSGSLCSKRGGACPDCVMIPETSCLTRNEILSRSFLAGGGVPHWDQNKTALAGYFDVVRGEAKPAAA